MTSARSTVLFKYWQLLQLWCEVSSKRVCLLVVFLIHRWRNIPQNFKILFLHCRASSIFFVRTFAYTRLLWLRVLNKGSLFLRWILIVLCRHKIWRAGSAKKEMCIYWTQLLSKYTMINTGHSLKLWLLPAREPLSFQRRAVRREAAMPSSAAMISTAFWNTRIGIVAIVLTDASAFSWNTFPILAIILSIICALHVHQILSCSHTCLLSSKLPFVWRNSDHSIRNSCKFS